jgi:DNA-binding GntR family transcriptional regulator
MREGIVTKTYKSMLHRIMIGEFKQREILTDVGLAKMLGTSRTPIREACVHLVNEGLLRIAPGRGYIVTEISLNDVRELYQLRLIIEPPAAELAANAPLPDEFFLTCSDMIKKRNCYANVGMSAALSHAESVDLANCEYDFHYEIARASGNQRITKIMGAVVNQLKRFIFDSRRARTWLILPENEHEEIMEAIRRHDGPEVRRLMQEHILRGSQQVIQAVLDSLAVQSA